MKITYLFPIAAALLIVLFYLGLPDLKTIPLPGDGGKDLSRRDALPLTLITLVYALVAFWNLGDTQAPQTVRSLDNESALIELDGETPIARMLIYTGMRIGELFSLPRSAYYGTYAIGGEKTEAGRNRVIPIWPEGREHFAYFAYFARPGGLLLSGYDGQKVAANYRKRDYYPLLDRLGIARKTPHATRHTYASMAVTAGIRPELLQKMLGHADYSTTANIYQHFEPQELVRAVENR